MKFCDTSGACPSCLRGVPPPLPPFVYHPGACLVSRRQAHRSAPDTAKVDVRVAAFVKELTLEEKAGIMVNNGQGVKRLHIPPYQWGSEGLHGPLQPCVPAKDGTTKCPTSFPAPSAMAPAFNDTLCAMLLLHRPSSRVSHDSSALVTCVADTISSALPMASRRARSTISATTRRRTSMETALTTGARP